MCHLKVRLVGAVTRDTLTDGEYELVDDEPSLEHQKGGVQAEHSLFASGVSRSSWNDVRTRCG